MPFHLSADVPALFNTLPSAVLFDFDHTLYDYYYAHTLAITAVKNKFCHDFNVLPKVFEETFYNIQDQLKKQLHKEILYNYVLCFKKMIEYHGFKTQALLALDLEQTYWHTFLTSITLSPGVLEMLMYLRSSGIKIALISDAPIHVQLRKLVYLDIDGYFDCIVTSEETGCDKVTEELYELALEKLDIPKSSNVWVIGHSLTDATIAKNITDSIIFQKSDIKNQKPYNEADINFDNFYQLIKKIKLGFSCLPTVS